MKSSNISTFFALLFLTTVYAVQTNDTDSLSNKSFHFFEVNSLVYKNDSIKAFHLANTWLKKAKKEDNIQEQVKAYRTMMHLVDKKFRMIYADSMLNKAIETKNNEMIGGAYLTVGAAYYDNKEYSNALDAYILANNSIANTKDQYLIHKVKYAMALTKYFLGYYDEAIALLTGCIDFFKEENDMAYVKSLHALSLCYTHLDRYDLSSFYNNLGQTTSIKYEIENMIPYFKNAEGINHFKQKEYKSAIKLLYESLPGLEKKNDHANKITSWFYLGKCFWEIKDKDKAVTFFLKVHEGIQTNKYRRPDLRENYEMLIEFYKENKELEKQLFFIEHLIEYDIIMTKEFKYLSYKIHKEYDTKTLLDLKLKIEKQLALKDKKNTGIVIFLAVVLIIVVGRNYKSKKREKLKFDKIMAEIEEKKNRPKVTVCNKNVSLSAELNEVILKNLENFEAEKKFLEKDMNLHKLATILDTNTKYVALIIANNRGKKTTTYINDLKTEYIVDLVIKNPKYRKYTNQALADEAGFGSSQIFTLCFKNKYGISPSKFTKQLISADEEKKANN